MTTESVEIKERLSVRIMDFMDANKQIDKKEDATLLEINDIGEYFYTDTPKHENGIAVDMPKFLEQMNGSVEYIDFETRANECHLLYHGENKKLKFEMFPYPFHTRQRNNFNLAHTLGHLFLHATQTKRKSWVSKFVSAEIETQANYFAAGLLMPRNPFIEIYKEYGGSVFDISQKFDVLMEHVRVRTKVFQLK